MALRLRVMAYLKKRGKSRVLLTWLIKYSSSLQVVFIDHASYGKPLWLETAGVDPANCPHSAFAGNEFEYCVASNALAALMYWCQGKEGCEVDPVRKGL